jgi:hypothetical protein
MWQTQKIEIATKSALNTERGDAQGEEKFAFYLNARKLLLEEVIEEIKSVEPSLTDHGPRHIANVLENIERVLGDDIAKLSGTELYCLILAALFHDAGNIKGRDDHQNKISKIYDFIRKDGERFKQEKLILLQVVGAHSGKAADRTKDTLKFLETAHLDARPVNLRHIAAILRFADELAEGPQRTSRFMQEGGYDKASEIYHEYANITEVCIDRGSKRIALTYNINVNTKEDGSIADEHKFKELVEFVYKRILKLDQERKYAKHYCSLLESFKKVSVVINFWAKNEIIYLGLEPLVLTDLVVPGDACKNLPEYDQSYAVENLIANWRAKK